MCLLVKVSSINEVYKFYDITTSSTELANILPRVESIHDCESPELKEFATMLIDYAQSTLALGTLGEVLRRNLRSIYLASLALLLRQQMTVSASRGKPNMHDTIGTTMDSGVTVTNKID